MSEYELAALERKADTVFTGDWDDEEYMARLICSILESGFESSPRTCPGRRLPVILLSLSPKAYDAVFERLARKLPCHMMEDLIMEMGSISSSATDEKKRSGIREFLRYCRQSAHHYIIGTDPRFSKELIIQLCKRFPVQFSRALTRVAKEDSEMLQDLEQAALKEPDLTAKLMIGFSLGKIIPTPRDAASKILWLMSLPGNEDRMRIIERLNKEKIALDGAAPLLSDGDKSAVLNEFLGILYAQSPELVKQLPMHLN